ncbi:hypothetical protein BGZ93_003660 [Podila epicladia]|nr:hypothetical protein BGZ92_002074 [Podila epicladia]KAG0100194.1 hypothetical protein BGZ93_003660 [Podila epicladia]
MADYVPYFTLPVNTIWGLDRSRFNDFVCRLSDLRDVELDHITLDGDLINKNVCNVCMKPDVDIKEYFLEAHFHDFGPLKIILKLVLNIDNSDACGGVELTFS